MTGYTTIQEPEGLIMFHLCYIGPQDNAYFTKVLNLSETLSWSRHPSYLEVLRYYPNFDTRKPRDYSCFYHLIANFFPIVKIMDWFLLPTPREALSALLSQHSFNPSHSTNLALFPIPAMGDLQFQPTETF